MKRKQISRMLAMLIIIMMVFTIIPSIALADEGIEDDGLSSVYWPNFRGNDVNMAIVDAPTPIDVDKTSELWSKQLSSGWDYPSPPIVVGEYLYVTSGTSITKIEKATGNIATTGTMAGNQGFASSTPPVYADGKIVVALSGGKIQAFNADTLESLWLYTDSLGGQCQSPLIYSDGYIYTGFWKNDSSPANFVCVDISDEDSTKTNETKNSRWVYESQGGFYWGGAVSIGNYILVGTNGGKVISLEKNTGTVVSGLETAGAVKSSIAYDKTNNNIYFTAKGGYIYKADIDETTGIISNLTGKIPAGEGGSAVITDSVSSPVVYDGKVYFVGSKGWSNPGYLCIVSADDLGLISAVQIGKNPQCSLLLITAYEETGYLYLYATYNSNPGGITMIKVPVDIDNSNQPETAELFTPESGAQNYCVCSVVCDENGTLYYKNDSGYLFAVNLNDDAVAEKKEQALNDLDAYKETDYDDDRWIKVIEIVNNAKTKINAATTINEINLALEDAKEKLDSIEKKTQEKDDIVIYVTIADGGKILPGSDYSETMLADAAVTISDTNKDGKHTVDEAFLQIHKKFCVGGVEGYKTEEFGWGTGIVKFWNKETTAVGYYINDISAGGLDAILNNKDYLTAFIYKDQTYWSDSYSMFDKNEYTGEVNKEITLTLKQAGYDANWNTVFSPCSDAKVEIIGSDNNAVPYYTDENGQVKLKFSSAGTFKAVAYKDDGSIVPAAATIKITDTSVISKNPKTGDTTNEMLFVYFIMLILSPLTVSILWKRKALKNKEGHF